MSSVLSYSKELSVKENEEKTKEEEPLLSDTPKISVDSVNIYLPDDRDS